MADTLYPVYYQKTLVTMKRLRELHEGHMHPEYARRLFNWIEAQDGRIGIGGGWRAGGTQKEDEPGFAPEGKSFHQDQPYNDGVVGSCAVDLVARNGSNIHRSPYWSEVPVQGSQEAFKWGVHCNVGVPGNGESWHMQPVEIDGWGRWWDAGRPAPVRDYPIPNLHPELEDMKPLAVPTRVYNSRNVSRFAAGETRKIPVGMVNRASLHFTIIGDQPGYISVSGTDERSNASVANIDGSTPGQTQVRHDTVTVALPDGHVRVYAKSACDVIIDVFETDSGSV